MYFLGSLHLEMVALVIAILNFVTGSAASTCSWSNEGCSVDSDCCSKSCHRPFEGVNPRCRHSTIGEPCIFSYHCGYDLDCGAHFNCCAPYWKMCVKNSDCCDPQHVCIPADGFYYDRCLYPSSASPVKALSSLTLVVSVATSLSACSTCLFR